MKSFGAKKEAISIALKPGILTKMNQVFIKWVLEASISNEIFFGAKNEK